MISITQGHMNRIPVWAIPTLMTIKCYTVPPKSRIIGIADVDKGKNPEPVGVPVVEFDSGRIGLLDIGSFSIPFGLVSQPQNPLDAFDFWLLSDEDRAYFEVPEAGNTPMTLDELAASETGGAK